MTATLQRRERTHKKQGDSYEACAPERALLARHPVPRYKTFEPKSGCFQLPVHAVYVAQQCVGVRHHVGVVAAGSAVSGAMRAAADTRKQEMGEYAATLRTMSTKT
jgi:hypothetical protein